MNEKKHQGEEETNEEGSQEEEQLKESRQQKRAIFEVLERHPHCRNASQCSVDSCTCIMSEEGEASKGMEQWFNEHPAKLNLLKDLMQAFDRLRIDIYDNQTRTKDELEAANRLSVRLSVEVVIQRSASLIASR